MEATEKKTIPENFYNFYDQEAKEPVTHSFHIPFVDENGKKTGAFASMDMSQRVVFGDNKSILKKTTIFKFGNKEIEVEASASALKQTYAYERIKWNNGIVKIIEC